MSWIKLSDELPPLCMGRGDNLNSVLVCRWPITGKYYPVAVARRTENGWIHGNQTPLYFEPSHYQPLPVPPKE